MGNRSSIVIFIDSKINIEETANVNWEFLERDIRGIFQEMYQQNDYFDDLVDISMGENQKVMRMYYRRDGLPEYDFIKDLSQAYSELTFQIEWKFENLSKGFVIYKNGKLVKRIELTNYGD